MGKRRNAPVTYKKRQYVMITYLRCYSERRLGSEPRECYAIWRDKCAKYLMNTGEHGYMANRWENAGDPAAVRLLAKMAGYTVQEDRIPITNLFGWGQLKLILGVKRVNQVDK